MNDELVDIVTSNGKRIGTVLKSEAHAKGFLHPIVRIILVNAQQQVYVQQRSSDKEKYPNRWEGAIAEHVKSGEPYRAAALRGIREECSIEANDQDLVEICTFAVTQKTEHPAYSILYSAVISQEPRISSEAQSSKWMHKNDLSRDISNNPAKYTPGFLEAWRLFCAQK